MGVYDSFYCIDGSDFQTKMFYGGGMEYWYMGDFCPHVPSRGHYVLKEVDYRKSWHDENGKYHEPLCYLHFLDGIWTGYITEKQTRPKELRGIRGIDLAIARMRVLSNIKNSYYEILYGLKVYTKEHIESTKDKKDSFTHFIMELHSFKDKDGKPYEDLDAAVSDIPNRLWHKGADLKIDQFNILTPPMD
jgi:hypothetical protein